MPKTPKMPTIQIHKLERVYPSGDWHDKPMKWGVFGPFEEVQHFSTKADAILYKRIRRDAENQIKAMVAFCRA